MFKNEHEDLYQLHASFRTISSADVKEKKN